MIRRIGYACKGHHTSALTVDSRFDSRFSDVDRFHEVGLRRYVRRAALENVQLDRADLAADLFLDPELELLAGPGEIAVTEDVDGSALGALADVASVRETDSLRNGDDDVRVDFQRRADVREELIVIERSLRQVDEVRSDAADFPRERRGSRQPSGVAPHYLDDSDGVADINRRVAKHLLHRRRDELRRGAEARRVVGADDVVVYRLRDAHHADIPAEVAFSGAARELRDRVHRIVSADIEEIAYIKLAEKREEPPVDLVPLGIVRVGQLLAAGAERCGGSVLEEPQILLGRALPVEFDHPTVEESFHAVERAVYAVDRLGCETSAYDPREGCVDGGGRTAGLSYDSVTFKHFVISFQTSDRHLFHAEFFHDIT